MAQIMELLLSKLALRAFDEEFVLSQLEKYFSQVCHMRLQVRTEHQYIIQKYHYKFPQEGFQYEVHETLKCCRCISESKGHHPELVMPMMILEGSFVLIFMVHSYLMKTCSKVHARKILSTIQFIQDFINNWHRELVLNG